MLKFFRRILVAAIVFGAVMTTAPFWAMLLHGIFAQAQHAELIVVPGAALKNGGSDLSDALRYRMDTAIQLWRDGYAPKLLLSGGGDGAWNEPAAMARYAMAQGVPESAIVLDSHGLTSRDTARNAARLLGAECPKLEASRRAADLSKVSGRRRFGLGDEVLDWLAEMKHRATATKPTVLVVSQWCHVPRMRVAMQHEGLRAYGAPCRHPRFLHNEGTMVLREAVGLWAYSFGVEDQVRDWLGGAG